MIDKKDMESREGVLTNAMDVNTKEFKEFQLFLSKKPKSIDEQQRLQVEL